MSPLTRAKTSLALSPTPLLDLTDILGAAAGTRILAKAEWHNPGGSVKDRAGLRIVLEAEKAGRLSGRRLLDATSGNTGIAYAWVCARLGVPLTLAVPGTLNPHRRSILEAYGAELLFTDPQEGTDGAIREARLLQAAEPDRYYYADQYNNDANWRAHYDGTAVEVFDQTEGAVTHFVAGLGTSGTFTGTTRRLRELKPSVRCLSVEPDNAIHGLEGLKHMATAIVPGIYDDKLADERLEVPTEDAQRLCRALARKGLLLGPSGGANLSAALKVAARARAEGGSPVVVTVLPDSGERYLSDRFWRE